MPGVGLPDLANENTGNLVKFELQINKYCMGQTYLKIFVVYLATLGSVLDTLKFYLF